jgi:dynactin-4
LPGSQAEDGQPRDSDIAAGFQKDEDVLEIPVFVHMEWDAEAQLEQQNVGKASKPDDLVARELAYWMVLGVGRIQASL